MSLNVSEIKKKAKTVLSMIGKRLSDKNGSTLFTSTTLSSVEENILDEYLTEGVSVFLGEFAPLLAYYVEGGLIMVKFGMLRVNAANLKVFKNIFTEYVVQYIRYKVFELSMTEQARQDIDADMQRSLSSAIKLIHTATAPASSEKTLTDMIGEVILN